MRTPSFYDPPMPDFSAINRSISWMTDPMLPALLEKTYQTIITNHDERPFFVAAYDALSEIAGYNKRLNVAYQLKDRLLNYLKSRYVEGEDLNQQNNEFDALIHYLQVLDTACSDSKEINKLYKENADKPIRRLAILMIYNGNICKETAIFAAKKSKPCAMKQTSLLQIRHFRYSVSSLHGYSKQTSNSLFLAISTTLAIKKSSR